MSESSPENDLAQDVVERLRQGMRQHRAEGAALAETRAGSGLLDLERTAYLEEPLPVSGRRWTGRLVVMTRKAVYHLFLKWYARPLLQQQNRFNHAAARRIEELVESERTLRQQIEELGGRVRTLERDRG